MKPLTLFLLFLTFALTPISCTDDIAESREEAGTADGSITIHVSIKGRIGINGELPPYSRSDYSTDNINLIWNWTEGDEVYVYGDGITVNNGYFGTLTASNVRVEGAYSVADFEGELTFPTSCNNQKVGLRLYHLGDKYKTGEYKYVAGANSCRLTLYGQNGTLQSCAEYSILYNPEPIPYTVSENNTTIPNFILESTTCIMWLRLLDIKTGEPLRGNNLIRVKVNNSGQDLFSTNSVFYTGQFSIEGVSNRVITCTTDLNGEIYVAMLTCANRRLNSIELSVNTYNPVSKYIQGGYSFDHKGYYIGSEDGGPIEVALNVK